MTKPRKPSRASAGKGPAAGKRRATKRNPMARSLASDAFRARVEESPERYRRHPKHKPDAVGDE